MTDEVIFDMLGNRGIRIPSLLLDRMDGRRMAADALLFPGAGDGNDDTDQTHQYILGSGMDWQKYLAYTPESGGEYYTLEIPIGVDPPEEGSRFVLNGIKVVALESESAGDIGAGRGGPIADKMRESGIAFRVNCLPEGHKWLKPIMASVGQDRFSRIASRIVSSERVAMDFPNQEELNKYMKEHPEGDRTRHHVVKTPQTKGMNERLTDEMSHGTGGWKRKDGKKLPPHVEKLVIPPAWKNVRYDPDPEAELVVQGVDAKGRVQSKYSESHIMKAAAAKFARVSELIKKREEIEKENQENMGEGKDDTAACLQLIIRTGIRPGSTRDTKAEKQAFGATTLQGRHVVKTKGGVSLKFVGKKGVDLDIPIRDKDLADELVRRAKKSGKDGRLFSTDESTLAEYTHTLDGGMFKPKDMRTMVGTMTAMEEVKKRNPPPGNAKDYVRSVREVATVVASRLGNTPVVCLQAYINPSVFAGWRKVEWGRDLA